MATLTPQLLLIASVAAVGVFHTIVPDHWVPITLIARQREWTKLQTARASLLAGTGHVVSTLIIALAVWFGGVLFAQRFGHFVDTAASVALVGFGGWIAISALRDLRRADRGQGHGHGHSHSHDFTGALAAAGIHGPELNRIDTPDGPIHISIFEADMPPHFRVTGQGLDRVTAETKRPDGATQIFAFLNRGTFWESVDEIPEPHGFEVSVTVGHDKHDHTYQTVFAEHAHDHDHGTQKKTSSRTALLLILGSSPMVEGIPAFFAAGKYGVGLITVMSFVFAITTIATYVVLCVASVASLQRVSFGPLERYGEVLSGAFIALVGLVFWIWPVL